MTDVTIDNDKLLEAIKTMALKSEAGELLNLAIEAPGLPSSIPLLFAENAGKISIADLRSESERWRIWPARISDVVLVDDLLSMRALIERHKNESSALFCYNESNGTNVIAAIIDYHTDSRPNWCKHKIKYFFTPSTRMKVWSTKFNTSLSQADLAELFEDCISDFASPNPSEAAQVVNTFRAPAATPSQIIALARGLELSVTANAVQATKLSTGEGEISYRESHEARNGTEKLIIPAAFVLNFPIFDGAAPERLIVRLRYRLKDGKILWTLLPWQLEELQQSNIVENATSLAATLKLPLYMGGVGVV